MNMVKYWLGDLSVVFTLSWGSRGDGILENLKGLLHMGNLGNVLADCFEARALDRIKKGVTDSSTASTLWKYSA